MSIAAFESETEVDSGEQPRVLHGIDWNPYVTIPGFHWFAQLLEWVRATILPRAVEG